jgi:response regulator of citrate/malate metabolism
MTLRTLIVDDAPAVASLHGRFVAAHPQCELVGTAGTGPDAVAAVRALTPDLVLLDVYLPGFSGIEALRAVRADRTVPQPEVIAVTAARDVDTVRDARMMGVRHYLVKPFTARELHERIDDVIADQRRQAGADTNLDQVAVDAAFRPTGRRPLPKGLTRETLDLVRASLARMHGGSAADVATAVGLSRVSCRRYLEHLADEGSARRTLDYSTSGRPSTRYVLVVDHSTD